jgi:uncharacterized membrane protein
MDSEVEGHAMTYRRTPHDQPLYVWSIDEQDTRILRQGFYAVTAGVLIAAAGIAIMDTAFAAFAVLMFLGLMIPVAAAFAVADHVANEPEAVGDTDYPTTSP